MLRTLWVRCIVIGVVITAFITFMPVTGFVVQGHADPHLLQFTISGRITQESGAVGGVRVYLYEAMNPDTPLQNVLTSPLLGSYAFADVAPGQYIVRPDDGRYTFQPGQQQVVLIQEDASNVNFLATPLGVTAGGRILDAADEGLGGVQVSLYRDNSDTPIATAQSGEVGEYGFPNVESGSYRVKPSSSLYDFVPIERTFTISTTNIITLHFQATMAVPTYAIQGQVLHRGDGLQEVTLTLTPEDNPQPIATAVTNGEGDYSFTEIPTGTYRLTPILSGYVFAPPYQDMMVTGNTVVGDFQAEVAVSSNRLLYLPVVRRR
jgi:hypothetical protein